MQSIANPDRTTAWDEIVPNYRELCFASLKKAKIPNGTSWLVVYKRNVFGPNRDNRAQRTPHHSPTAAKAVIRLADDTAESAAQPANAHLDIPRLIGNYGRAGKSSSCRQSNPKRGIEGGENGWNFNYDAITWALTIARGRVPAMNWQFATMLEQGGLHHAGQFFAFNSAKRRRDWATLFGGIHESSTLPLDGAARALPTDAE